MKPGEVVTISRDELRDGVLSNWGSLMPKLKIVAFHPAEQ
jgi:hypothetical protein